MCSRCRQLRVWWNSLTIWDWSIAVKYMYNFRFFARPLFSKLIALGGDDGNHSNDPTSTSFELTEMTYRVIFAYG
jgi:hypothetical protein